MLMLTRKVGECIIIGKTLHLILLEFSYNRAKINIFENIYPYYKEEVILRKGQYNVIFPEVRIIFLGPYITPHIPRAEIGIEAPKSIQIMRSELIGKPKGEKKL